MERQFCSLIVLYQFIINNKAAWQRSDESLKDAPKLLHLRKQWHPRDATQLVSSYSSKYSNYSRGFKAARLRPATFIAAVHVRTLSRASGA